MTAHETTMRGLQRALDLTPPGTRASWELQSLIRRRILGRGSRSAPLIVLDARPAPEVTDDDAAASTPVPKPAPADERE